MRDILLTINGCSLAVLTLANLEHNQLLLLVLGLALLVALTGILRR